MLAHITVSGVARERGQVGTRAPGRRLGGASTRFIQPFKNAFLNRYLDQKLYFFEKKSCKIAAASKDLPLNLHWSPVAGRFASYPNVVTPA